MYVILKVPISRFIWKYLDWTCKFLPVYRDGRNPTITFLSLQMCVFNTISVIIGLTPYMSHLHNVLLNHCNYMSESLISLKMSIPRLFPRKQVMFYMGLILKTPSNHSLQLLNALQQPLTLPINLNLAKTKSFRCNVSNF